MKNLRESLLLLSMAGLLTACSDSDSSRTTDRDEAAAPPLTVQALEPLTLPATQFGDRAIRFDGDLSDALQARLDSGAVTVSLTQNAEAIPVDIVDGRISTSLTLDNNINTIRLTLNDGNSEVMREFTVDFPFVSLSTFQSADVVVGQTDFTQINSDTTASNFSTPYGNAYIYEGRLYLPDYGNNRILGFNEIPTNNGASADFVLGQEDFISANSDGDGLVSLGGPQTMQVVDGKFYVITYDAHRIVVTDEVPTTTGQLLPSFVVGQASPEANESEDCSAATLNSPETFIISDGKLIVTDTSNNRVLIWNTLPTVSGVAADVVLGHDNFTCGDIDTPTVEPITLLPVNPEEAETDEPLSIGSPGGVWSNGEMLIVADSDNDQLLIWQSFPTTNNQEPDLIIGPEIMVAGTEDTAPSESEEPETLEVTSLDFPYHLYSNGNQLFLSDFENNRVLVWNTLPTSTNQEPDVILGQSNLQANTENDDNQDGQSDRVDNGESETTRVTSARTLSNPAGAYTANNQLIITDEGNSRYLIFNGLDTSSLAP
ncbi:Uncharacterised protein [BD1-7 clade bacterium]|uniref:Uncharacterized protein n=1 Tax=BD1-7 clade bacterium TaxID=2029982 RepID=A0A5S9PG85_9GAMM|nr:Uncharacterised protein [BD1-7 clade bacterium]